jgi:hypothetical protein
MSAITSLGFNLSLNRTAAGLYFFWSMKLEAFVTLCSTGILSIATRPRASEIIAAGGMA